MADKHPSDRYPDLTSERLGTVASILARERDDAATDHRPEKGETDFTLGVSAWERTKAAIIHAAQDHRWLHIVDGGEAGPSEFVFSIGVYPFRFYHGTPKETPTRYLLRTEVEKQYPLFFDANQQLLPKGHCLRFSIATNGRRRTATIELVEIDQYEEIVDTWTIPFSATSTVTVFPGAQKAEGVDLPAPAVEVIQSERKQQQGE
jgi:hypothetical protein